MVLAVNLNRVKSWYGLIGFVKVLKLNYTIKNQNFEQDYDRKQGKKKDEKTEL